MTAQIDMFRIMTLVKEEYTGSKMTDAQFAVEAAKKLQIDVSRAQITQYRKVLGIQNNVPNLDARVRALKEACELLDDCRAYVLSSSGSESADLLAGRIANFISEHGGD